ncbi:hypothetical protein ACAW74_18095 [Fibrella sp. WM1]|uniref:hypothetical protein n=1 Tax=Fibrella musci TaxID=3242485 RepID=UPI0035226B9E
MKLTPTNAFIGLLIVALLAVGYGLWTRRRTDGGVTVDDMAGMVNIAPLANLTTSSTYENPTAFKATKTILSDILPTPYNWDMSSGWNDNTRSVFPDWVVLEWPTSVKIGQVTVTSLAGKEGGSYLPGTGAAGGNLGLKDYVVQIWNGTDWQTVSTVAGNDRDQVTSNLASVVTTQKLRVYITASQDGTWSRITQIQVKGKVA